jgi:hypothetical protein
MTVIPMPLDAGEREGLRRSAAVLREAIQSLNLTPANSWSPTPPTRISQRETPPTHESAECASLHAAMFQLLSFAARAALTIVYLKPKQKMASIWQNMESAFHPFRVNNLRSNSKPGRIMPWPNGNRERRAGANDPALRIVVVADGPELVALAARDQRCPKADGGGTRFFAAPRGKGRSGLSLACSGRTCPADEGCGKIDIERRHWVLPE